MTNHVHGKCQWNHNTLCLYPPVALPRNTASHSLPRDPNRLLAPSTLSSLPRSSCLPPRPSLQISLPRVTSAPRPPPPTPPLGRKLKHCTEHIQSAMYIYISTTKYRVSIIIIVVVHTRAKLEKAMHARLTRATRKQNQIMRKCSTSTNRRF